jgi:hypothetical protein
MANIIYTPNGPNPSNLEYIPVSRRFENSGSGTGAVWTYVYRGSKDALRVQSVNWINAGCKVTIDETGPYATATVIFNGPTSNPSDPIENAFVPGVGLEEGTFRYEFKTDYVELSLFSLPAVMAEANKYISVSQYRYDIENAVKNGESLTMSQLNFPLAYKIWAKLARGQESFPVSRVSLSKVGSFSGNNGLPQIPDSMPPVYSTTALSFYYQLPTTVQRLMPRPPTNPLLQPVPGTAWGWLQTNQSTTLVEKTNQVEQTQNWTFAAWDLDIYPYIN